MGKRRRVPEGRSKGRDKGQSNRRSEGRNNRPAVITGVVAVAVVGAVIGGYALVGGGADDRKDSAATSVDPSQPLSEDEVTDTARWFLAAWQHGRVLQAALTTSDADAANTQLARYAKDARLKSLTLTAGSPKGTRVPFTVKGTVSYDGVSKPLTYSSALTVARRKADGAPQVQWQPSVVHPDLRVGDRLVTGEAGSPPVKALDRNGHELSVKTYPSLAPVLDSLREKYGEKSGGVAGIDVRIERAKPSGKAKDSAADLPDKTVLELRKGVPGKVRTTLDPRIQAAAEKQVTTKPKAALVVLKASTGEILAVANSSHNGFNTAFQGSLAPGSTMKVITSALFLERHIASIDKKHPCPKVFEYGGWKFHNDDNFEIKDGTFRASFAASCNTAFISQAGKLSDSDLGKEAREIFGLGMNNWSIGVSSFDGAVPAQSQAQKAAELMGQGGVRMNPLNMASVAATVKSGTFHQPYLVSPSVDNRTLATAPRKMSAGVLSQLRELMRYTAQAGTAAGVMSGLGPDYGAKTGSAEVDGQKEANGWLTAWKGDVASAGVVQAGGHGIDSAGPMVASLLKTANGG